MGRSKRRRGVVEAEGAYPTTVPWPRSHLLHARDTAPRTSPPPVMSSSVSERPRRTHDLASRTPEHDLPVPNTTTKSDPSAPNTTTREPEPPHPQTRRAVMLPSARHGIRQAYDETDLRCPRKRLGLIHTLPENVVELAIVWRWSIGAGRAGESGYGYGWKPGTPRWSEWTGPPNPLYCEPCQRLGRGGQPRRQKHVEIRTTRGDRRALGQEASALTPQQTGPHRAGRAA